MAKLIIEGITFEQAKALAHWYEGQGEQDAMVYFEIKEIPTPMSDMSHEGGYMKIDKEKEEVTLYCK